MLLAVLTVLALEASAEPSTCASGETIQLVTADPVPDAVYLWQDGDGDEDAFGDPSAPTTTWRCPDGSAGATRNVTLYVTETLPEGYQAYVFLRVRVLGRGYPEDADPEKDDPSARCSTTPGALAALSAGLGSLASLRRRRPGPTRRAAPTPAADRVPR